MSGVKYQKVKLKSSKPSPDRPTFYMKEKLGSRSTERFIKQKSTFFKGNKIIGKLTSDLRLPEQVEGYSKNLWRRYSNSGDMQGRRTDDSAVATVYLSARLYNIPRSLDVISKKSDIPKVRISRAAKAIKKSQRLAIRPPVAPELISSAGVKLNLKGKQVSDSIRLANMYYKKGLAGSSAPGTVAAVAVYESSDKTQKQVAKAFGISDTTLRNARTRIKKSGGK